MKLRFVQKSELMQFAQSFFAEGETVRYSNPEPGEEEYRFIVRENNGNRVIIELVSDLPIRPQETVSPTDIEKV